MGFGKVDKNIDFAEGDILIYAWDGSAWIPQKVNTSGEIIIGGSLIKEDYDYIALTYVSAGNGAGEIETVTFKTGGSDGTTVATLTLAYDGSDNLTSITKV